MNTKDAMKSDPTLTRAENFDLSDPMQRMEMASNRVEAYYTLFEASGVELTDQSEVIIGMLVGVHTGADAEIQRLNKEIAQINLKLEVLAGGILSEEVQA